MLSNRRKRVGWFVTAMMMVMACSAWGKVIYVDDDAPAPGDGLSWNTAYTYLRDAQMEAWVTPGEIEIRVAQGVYKPDRSSEYPDGTRDRTARFHLLGGFTLRGGYAGITGPDPNARDVERYPSVLSGDLAGNDVELTNPLDAETEPTRADNSYHLIVNGTWGKGGRPVVSGVNRVLDGFVITGGYAPDSNVYNEPGSSIPGAAVYVSGTQYWLSARVVIRNCKIVGNYSKSEGGAISCEYGDVVLERCTIVWNGALGDGGGMDAYRSRVELTACRFVGNRAGKAGGGMSCEGSDVKLSDCEFSGNAAGSAGALNIDDSGTWATADLTNCTFVRNWAESYGGAMENLGNVRAHVCRFIANEAGIAGGAIANSDDMSLVNCLFAGNEAGINGGAITTYFGELIIVNCTAHGNRATNGSFLLSDVFDAVVRGPVFISNSIISGGSGDIWVDRYGAITIEYTCLGEDPNAIYDPQATVILGEGNMTADPCFAAPGYWDPNGTPEDGSDDFWVDGDYHLKSQTGRWDPNSQDWVQDEVHSLCIDAGDPNSTIDNEPFPNSGRINMGAYGGTAEASKSYFGGPVCETIIAGDINGDCRVDFVDLALLMRHWLETGEHAEE